MSLSVAASFGGCSALSADQLDHQQQQQSFRAQLSSTLTSRESISESRSTMLGDFNQLPILPASSSLASHLQALDLLAARLATLSSRSEWETKVPISSKASVSGSIVGTANVKINIGGEWWVDMTPQEAEAWVRRRKEALLEEHAKVLEGWRPGQAAAEPSSSATKPETESAPRFDPVFRSPVAMPTQARVNQAGSDIVAEGMSKKETPAPDKGKGKGKMANTVAEPSPAAPTPKPVATPQTIEDVLKAFMEKQETLAQATGKTSMPNGTAADVMINEEGLPIHEIREDENGRLIGDLPTLSTSTAAGPGATISPVEEEPRLTEVKSDFYSDDAAARRAALRRKVFDDPSDSESDAAEDVGNFDEQHPKTPLTAEPASSSSAPVINAIPPTPSSPSVPALPPQPARRSLSSAPMPGKSILKTAAPRKKSVSFDSSIPDSPDSPAPPSDTRIAGSLFPTPVINIESGIEEKKVPMLNAPKPKVPSPQRSSFDNPFAGFKPGFLSGSTSASSSDSGRTTSPSVITAEPRGISEQSIAAPPSSTAAAPEFKKPSLFAQRQRDTPGDAAVAVSAGPDFPSMSASKGTSSVKNAVLEKPSPPSQPKPQSQPQSTVKGQGQTAGVAQSVMERPTEPVAGPSRLNGYLPEGEDEEEDGDDDDDDDDFYRDDDDEEEEYDLDDALLAREIALAYHQNRAYTELGRPRGQGEDEEDEGEEGGVMLGLPEISVLGPDGMPGSGSGQGGGGRPQIINPTPDNLRRFVRVGKLDNGKFVLAPGETGWSDEEEGDEAGGGNDKRENREEIRRALLGQQTDNVRERTQPQQVPGRKQKSETDMGMPPTIGTASTAASALHDRNGMGGVKERVTESAVPEVQVADAPKKVSRFKATRLGNA